ncbi:MAG: YhfC family glutamic-type intramembrane protease [Chloroflexota bacterium]
MILFYTLFTFFMIVWPVGLAIFFKRRVTTPWWLFVVGIVTFVGSQVYHIPLNSWLEQVGLIQEFNIDAPNFWRTALVLGASAGLSETIARVISFWLIQRKRPFQQKADALFVGLGHGGIEAMLIGGVLLAASISGLWALRGANLASAGVPAANIPLVEQQLASLETLTLLNFVPFLERLIAVTLHVTLSLLVWQGMAKKNWLYVLIAVAYHTAIDATAVYLTQLTQNIWLIELVLLLFLIPALYYLWQHWPAADQETHQKLRSVRHQLRLFQIAMRKELVQLWQTKRVFVISAIFLLFGLGSPILANLTPQLLEGIEGAEQFADLIPTPTNADALNQYIRNITQFGFMIAILIGMGAVAGEKEQKTAVMILSKPLPRWAFLLSKFTAQAILYFGAFLVSSLAAYYYTLLLFEPFAIWPFLLGNFLLLVWLLVFTAVTLLGSTIAKTTTGAAGIAIGGAILFLILGAIPQISPLMPSGLIGWASQLGLNTAVSANGGALASNIVLIIVMLISAVAAFEVQEL